MTPACSNCLNNCLCELKLAIIGYNYKNYLDFMKIFRNFRIFLLLILRC